MKKWKRQLKKKLCPKLIRCRMVEMVHRNWNESLMTNMQAIPRRQRLKKESCQKLIRRQIIGMRQRRRNEDVVAVVLAVPRSKWFGGTRWVEWSQLIESFQFNFSRSERKHEKSKSTHRPVKVLPPIRECGIVLEPLAKCSHKDCNKYFIHESALMDHVKNCHAKVPKKKEFADENAQKRSSKKSERPKNRNHHKVDSRNSEK